MPAPPPLFHRIALAVAALALLTGLGACSHSEERIKNLSTGRNTQAWINEQRNDVNRTTDPEPYPADRAGQALKRYETGPGSAPGATGSGARSTPSAATPSAPGAAGVLGTMR